MGRTYTRLALLALAFALGTYGFGWWAVPVVGLVWGLASPQRAAFRAGGAAAIAWGLMLVLPAVVGVPIFSFGGKLAAAMTMPQWALYAAELVFPFAAAASAAALGSGLRGTPMPDRAAASQ